MGLLEEMLPEEMILTFMGNLSIKSLSNLMQCSKKFYRIGHDEKLWISMQEFPYRVRSLSGKRGLTKWLAHAVKDQKLPLAPPARLCPSAVVYQGFMYINGGHNTQENSQMFREVRKDFWRMDLVTKKWEEIVEPCFPARTEHTAVVYGDRLWLFGGFSGTGFLNDMICYDLEHKEVLAINPRTRPPNPRSAHGAVVHGTKMWVFGGWDGAGQNNDLYSFDLETYTWEQVETEGPQPHARCSHCVALAPDENSFFVFGGYGGDSVKYLSDLWQFNFGTKRWTQVGALSPRSRMKMITHNNKLYTYGGWNSQEHFADMYEFNIKERSWRQIETGHKPGCGKMGQYSAVTFNNMCYIFGGYNDDVGTSSNEIQAYRLARPDFTETSSQSD